MAKSKSADKLCLELISYLWTADELSKRSITARKANGMLLKRKFSPDKVRILEGRFCRTLYFQILYTIIRYIFSTACHVHKSLIDKPPPPSEFFSKKEVKSYKRTLEFTAKHEASKVIEEKLRQRANYCHYLVGLFYLNTILNIIKY